MTNRNGRMLQLNASRHDDDDDEALVACFHNLWVQSGVIKKTTM